MSRLLYCYLECHCAECHYAECSYAECHYAECHSAECHYAECPYAECRGSKNFIRKLAPGILCLNCRFLFSHDNSLFKKKQSVHRTFKQEANPINNEANVPTRFVS